MVYFAQAIKYDIKSAVSYSLFCSIFMLLAVILNISIGANMMFFSVPWRIPIPVLHQIREISQFLYTTVMILVHLSIAWIMLFIIKLIDDGYKRRRLRMDNKEE